MAQHIEDNLQAACVQWFGLQFPRLRRLLLHIPNGGNRNLREAARLKKAGVVAGAPDLVLFIPNGQYNTLCIEMKTGEGRQTETQKSWQELAEKYGNRYVICRDFDDFRCIILNYLQLKKLLI